MKNTLYENIDWVGFVDWNVRDFHSYNTNRGATYNSYLIRDEKTALIDTVKAPYADNLLRNIASLTDFNRINYVICNHAEPDHSGSLPRVMQALPGATLICDQKCHDILSLYYNTANWKVQLVSTGDTISLGRHSLHFIETPMVHWPDSMFTYVPEQKLLFSMDAFGQHYATSLRFDDQVSLCTVMEEAKTYYANIVMPYSKRVAALLDEAASLDIAMIAPSHGLIWRSHIPEIINAYRNWAHNLPKPKVLILYDTMWQSTAAMAQALLEGATRNGVETTLLALRDTNLTQIATEFLDTAAVALGSSTLNQGYMPMMGAALTYLQGLRPAGKTALAFGSFGWGRGGPEAIQQWLHDMKWHVLQEPIKAKYKPTPDILQKCRQAGQLLAEKAIENSQRKTGQNLCVDP